MLTRDFFKLEGNYLKAFVGLAIFSLIYILPILIANFYYIDDLGRSLHGYTNWKYNGRPLADLLAIILSDGKPLMDVSPWIQIMSVGLLDYVLVLFARKFIPKASVMQIIIISSFAYLNLFLLENLSYKYDSFGMIFSLGIFLLLFALPEKDVHKKYLMIFSALAALISLCLYQASVGVYISLTVLEVIAFLYDRQTWRNILDRISVRVVGLVFGGLVYKFIIANKYVEKEGYSAEHASFLNPFANDSMQIFWGNLTAFGEIFKDYWMTMGILGILLFLTLYFGLGNMARYVWKNRDDAPVLKIISVVFLMISPAVLLLASVIFLSMLRVPVVAPRVMLSFTVFPLFMGLVIYNLSKTNRWFGKKAFLTLGTIALMCILSFSSYYGNLLNRQEKTNSMIANFILHDINDIEGKLGSKVENISFVGHSPKCRELVLADRKKPLYGRLVPIYMNNGWFWGGVYLEHYRKNKVTMRSEIGDSDYIKANRPVKINEFYQLYLTDDKLIIYFFEE